MSLQILHLTYVLLVFSIAHEEIRGLTIINANDRSTKDIRILISPLRKNSVYCIMIRKNDERIVCNVNYNKIEKTYDVWDIGNSIVQSNEYNSAEHITTKKIRIQDESIVCSIQYNEFWNLSASWSFNESHSDYSQGLFLVDYAMHADSFQDFVRKYPNLTITTSGKAVSDATFGDVGKGKFGKLTYSTSLFAADKDVYYEALVKASASKLFSFDVGVNIGIGFMSRGNSTLRLAPYIDGYIVSHGAYERTLEYGLAVTEVTFNPK